jgi:hypothetical protein
MDRVRTENLNKQRQERRSYRRLMAKASGFSDEGDFSQAQESYEIASEAVQNYLAQNPQDRWAMRDLARIYSAVADLNRTEGLLDAALTAQRACHDIVVQLAELSPQNMRRQHNRTVIQAALRDTLQEKGEDRLAIAAARMTAATAEMVADQFPDEVSLRQEAIQQRLHLAGLLGMQGSMGTKKQSTKSVFKDTHIHISSAEAQIICLKRALESAQHISLENMLDEDVWDTVRRTHLELANRLQYAHRYSETHTVLHALREIALVRLSLNNMQISCIHALALVEYLDALVYVMEKDKPKAITQFMIGLQIYDRLITEDFLSDDVQQQRAKFLSEAWKAASEIKNDLLQETIAQATLNRFLILSEEAVDDRNLQYELMARAHELARVLLSRNAPELALMTVNFAHTMLARRSIGELDRIFVRRWLGFLRIEEGRALRALNRTLEAQTALQDGLSVNYDLMQEDPSDVRAQCDVAFAEWQLAPLVMEQRTAHLRRSRAILRLLERCGQLPDYARRWISDIERDLRVA